MILGDVAYPFSRLARPPCMTLTSILKTNGSTIFAILAVMAVIALVEAVIPLHPRGRWNRAHLGPNLALTGITFATNVFFNAGALLLVAWLDAIDFGILRWASIGGLPGAALAVVGLDFSFYVAHVAMHKVPAFWKVHRVHHSDPAVDVTTTVRQHPIEGVIRYAFMAAFAGALGVSLGAFTVYRAWSAISGLLEHANIRAPRWLDAPLSYVATWPHMHKVHHSRDLHESATNYGNCFPWFDRLLGTFTPSDHGRTVSTGVEGLDDPSMQTTFGLLAMPFVESAEATGQLDRSPTHA